MDRRWWRALLILLGVGATTFAIAGSDVVYDALLQRARGSGTSIVPDRFVRSWDPVTVFFASARVAGPMAEDQPQRFVQLDPPHEGAWTWLDGRTLQFRPAEPWPSLQAYEISAGGERATLYTLLSPPSAMSPSDGARGLDPVDTLSFTFDEYVEPRVLARMVTIEHRALPGLSGPATRVGPEDFEVKALDRARRADPVQYVVVLDDPIPSGRAATVRVRLSADDSAPEARFESRFETAEPFRPTEIGCGSRRLPVSPEGTRHPAERPVACDGGRSVQVVFTSQLGTVGPLEAKNLVRFEPSVENLRI